MALIRLIYCSRPVEQLDDIALEALIAPIRLKSVTNNGPRRITGALSYSETCFAQAMEGEADVVDALFARISKDPRHTKIAVIERREITSRMFADWSMAFTRVDPRLNLREFSARDLQRFLLESAQSCDGVRSLPGVGVARTDTRLRHQLGMR